MTFSIGPITLRYLTSHTWSASRSVSEVGILHNFSSAYTQGENLVSYTLIGEFNADTPTEARRQRKQLNELASNPSIQYVYIEFSGDDKVELSGWYSIENLDTSIEAAVFDAFAFTMTVKRVNSSAMIFQTWKSRPYNHLYLSTALPWVALPENRGSYSDYERVGVNGIKTPIHSDTSVVSYLSPFLYQNSIPIVYPADFDPNSPLSGGSKFYTSRCYMFDTTTQTDVTTADNDPSEATWVERYGTHFKWEGDAVFGNTLVRYIWSSAELYGIFYFWTGSNWEKICVGPGPVFSSVPTSASFNYPPIVTYFDWNTVEWYQIATSTEKRSMVVKFKLLRGSQFISIAMKSEHGNLLNTSFITKTSGNSFVGNDDNVTTSNYRSVNITTPLATGVKYGLSFVDGGANSGSGGTIFTGITKEPNNWLHMGLFMLNNPSISSSLSPSILSRQFLANMSFKERIVNIREFV